jgi:hypothetical protein
MNIGTQVVHEFVIHEYENRREYRRVPLHSLKRPFIFYIPLLNEEDCEDPPVHAYINWRYLY